MVFVWYVGWHLLGTLGRWSGLAQRASRLPPAGGPPIPATRTNIVLDVRFDSSTVVVDPDAPPDRRFVMSLTPIWMPTFLDKRPQNSTLCTCPFGPCCYAIFTSADIHLWNLWNAVEPSCEQDRRCWRPQHDVLRQLSEEVRILDLIQCSSRARALLPRRQFSRDCTWGWKTL